MSVFIKKIVLFCLLVVLINLAFISIADGVTDPYYSKLSSSRQQSLVLGASRASEGIIPSVINSVCAEYNDSIGLYNFAFSNSDSPYGPVYLEAVKKKINKKTGSTFILSVHPWSISLLTDLESEEGFLEERLTLGKVSTYSGTPNYNYFLNAYEYGAGNVLLRKMENKFSSYLHEQELIKNGIMFEIKNDGWFENTYFNTSKEAQRKRMTIKNNTLYEKNNNLKYRFAHSPKRIDFLNETIQYLKQYGTVYLVRIPVDPEVIAIEHNYMPSFDSIMTSISEQNKVKYITMKEKYSYSDGHHLDLESAHKYSTQLANIIHANK